ncbi:MAG: HAD family hydrolase [Kordiimonadaceae bacterium]|jgi:HAD superfamily hydrolase (TIGR01509 family)|nr:HAD family hydrolase [Kordiimonadaceae bacterium]MBT6032812.1 HAD family hydrolase [Kordiimonadaceae bacterium]
MDYDLIIFDCDGVLVDSEPLSNQLLRDTLAGYGLDMTLDDVIDTFVGRSMSKVVSIAEDLGGFTLPDNFLDILQEETFEIFKRDLKPVEGIDHVLKTLQQKNHNYCLASSGSFDKMDLTLGLTGLRGYFGDNIYNSSLVKRGKPYPDLFLHAAHEMSVEPARCLVIEDSHPGVQAAVAAGMEVMAYSVRGFDDKLKKAGGLVFKDMRDILSHVLDN